MARFSYASVEDVAPLVRGGVAGDREDMLRAKLEQLSAQLSGWFPGLKSTYKEAKKAIEAGRARGEEVESDLVDLVESMVVEAGRRFIINPEDMSSETIGVFAYSRFEAADPSKGPFSPRDLTALKALLDEQLQEQVGSFKMNLGQTMYPAAPMPTPRTYTNSLTLNRWGR